MAEKKEIEVKTPRKPRSTASKTTARKTSTTRAKKVSSATISESVASNARHIEENAKVIQNNSNLIHILYGVIIALLVAVAGLAFYVGTLMGNTSSQGSMIVPATGEDITITVIDDSRCSDCQTDAIVEQLEALPFLAGANFIRQDFSEDGVSEFMQDNNLTNIPSVIFNTNNINDGGQITPYLTAINNNQYSLTLPETFDPFANRSDKGFLVLDDMSVVENIKTDSYIDGNPEAQITWIEYSDLECPFCAKLHNDGTQAQVIEAFPENVNIVFQHFPLDIHPNAQKAGEALECIADQNEDTYYTMIEASFETYNNNNFSLEGFYDLAAENGINREALVTCVDSGDKTEKVQAQMAAGQTLFGITGTPGNVIINNETGEYEIISGAYPVQTFNDVIDRMLN